MENKIKAKTYGVQVMMNEHDNILEFLKVVRKACVGVMNGIEIGETDFYGFIDFARNYSDKHHHGQGSRRFGRGLRAEGDRAVPRQLRIVLRRHAPERNTDGWRGQRRLREWTQHVHREREERWPRR